MDEQDREASLGLWIALILAIVVAIAVAISAPLLKRATSGAQKPAATAAAPAVEHTPSLGTISILRADEKVTLKGEVPDERAKDRVVSKAILVFGSGNIVDEIVVKPGAEPIWWKKRPLDVMARLRAVPTFTLILHGGKNATIEGLVPSEAAKEDVARWLSENLVDGLELVNNLKWDTGIRVITYDPSVLLAERIEFATGSAEIPEPAKLRLALVAAALVEEGYKVKIVGHTDDTGEPEANRVLSLRRAESVKVFLVAQGVPEANLATEGAGQDRPVADNATPEGRQHNRRIEFVQ